MQSMGEGGKVQVIYLTMGEYDIVVVVEMPSDEGFTRLMLKLAKSRAVGTKTMKAFDETTHKMLAASA